MATAEPTRLRFHLTGDLLERALDAWRQCNVETLVDCRKHLIKTGQDDEFDKPFDAERLDGFVLNALWNILPGQCRRQHRGDEIIGRRSDGA